MVNVLFILALSGVLEKTFQDIYFKLSQDHKVNLEVFCFFESVFFIVYFIWTLMTSTSEALITKS